VKEISIQNKKLVIDIKKTWESALLDSKSAMKKAILTGELLTKLKENTPHGEWESTLNVSFDATFGRFHAAKLMRISSNKLLISVASNGEELTINEMAKLVSSATPEQLEIVKQLQEVEELRKINAEAAKIAKAALKNAPEIIEGEFVEVKTPEPAAEKPEKINIEPKHIEDDPKELLMEIIEQQEILVKELQSENLSLVKIHESNEPLQQALEELKRAKAIGKGYEDRMLSLQNERKHLMQAAQHWQRKYEKLVKSNATA